MRRTWLRCWMGLGLAGALAAGLAACGGGGGGGDDGAQAPQAQRSVLSGPIAGFGSILVGGVELDLAGTQITVDDNPSAGEDDLKLGMMVTVEAEVSGSTGTATSVVFEDNLEGPVQSVSAGLNRFVAAGQTVEVDDLTVFDGVTLESLAIGMVVEVSGLPDASGVIHATRVEKKADALGPGMEVEVKGTVSNLDAAAQTFRVGTLTVDYASAAFQNLSAEALADGVAVEVKGTEFTGTTLVAASVEGRPNLPGQVEVEAADDARVEGIVTAFTDATSFSVAGMPVDASGAVTFENGAAADLGLGVKLQVEGSVANGTLVATKISFRPEATIRIEGPVDAVDAAGGTITVLGITMRVPDTVLVDDRVAARTLALVLDGISAGDWVEIRAFQDAEGNVVARRVERDEAEDLVTLQGPVQAEDETAFSLTILGVLADLGRSGVRFEDRFDLPLTRDGFFARVAPGTIVRVLGTMDGTTLVGDKAEIQAGGIVPDEGSFTLIRDVMPIFRRSCLASSSDPAFLCHVPGGQSASGENLPLDTATSAFNTLLNTEVNNQAGRLVVPGDPEGSELYQRVIGTAAGTQMPLGGPFLTEDEQGIIRAWIAGGAALGENTPPVADAGPDQTVPTGQRVTLDGRASSDPDGDALRYTWSLFSWPMGSTAQISDPTDDTPHFTPDLPGRYVFHLVVNDGIDSSPADEMVLTAEGDGEAPPPEPRARFVTFTEDVQPIFTASCAVAGCHVPGGAPMSLRAGESYDNLVNVSSRVVPGAPSSSTLYLRVSGTSLGPQMPRGGPALSPDLQDAIKDWIDMGAFQDLSLSLDGMTPHVGQLTQLRIVNAATGELAARIILDPLPGESLSLFLPVAVPPGDHNLDFFADHNGNRVYNPPPLDHAWREAIPSATGQVAFTHNTTFTNVGGTAGSEGLPFVLNLSQMTPHVGQVFEVRVRRRSTGQTVGAYRLGEIPGPSFQVAIPGIIESGEDYQVDFFADHNGNGAYDAPPADHAWRMTGVAGATGLVVNFTHNTDFADVQMSAVAVAGSPAPRAAARGTITAKGSIVMDDLTISTEGAEIEVEGVENPTDDDLKVGMKVEVEAEVDETTDTVTATRIRTEEAIRGPFEAVVDDHTLTVMGQTVVFDPTDPAVLDDSIVGGIGGLSAGDVLEVHGDVLPDGTVAATFIELEPTPVHFKVKGVIAGTDVTAMTFRIGALTVDYSGADLSDLPGNAPADGLFVEVEGSPALGTAGELVATKVESDALDAPEAQEMRVEGAVTAVEGASFEVEGQPAQWNAGTLFVGGTSDDLVPGAFVEVEGPVSAGVILADKVEFQDEIDLESDLAAVGDDGSLTLAGLGLTVAVDENLTEMRDAVGTGDHVRIRAFRLADGSLMATRVERRSAGTTVRLQGPVDSAADPVVTILGIAVDTTGFQDDDFQDISDATLGRAGFFGAVGLGTLVQAKGDLQEGGGVLWREVQLEEAD